MTKGVSLVYSMAPILVKMIISAQFMVLAYCLYLLYLVFVYMIQSVSSFRMLPITFIQNKAMTEMLV